MVEAKKIENIIKSSELYETIEAIQDCLSHFEELDYVQEYNIITPSIKENLLQEECQCRIVNPSSGKCYCVSASLNALDRSTLSSRYELDLKGLMIDGDRNVQESEFEDVYIPNFIKSVDFCEYVELKILFQIKSRGIPKKILRMGLEYLKSICKIDDIKLEVHYNPYSDPDLIFTKLIESSKFIGPDPIDSLPDNLITKFKEFAKKNNLSLSGKKELVNLLSRVKWED